MAESYTHRLQNITHFCHEKKERLHIQSIFSKYFLEHPLRVRQYNRIDPKMVKDHKKQIPAPDREIASTISIHTYRFHSFCLSYPQDTLMCVIPWTHYTILAFWILATFQVFHLWWHHSPFALLLFWISVSLFCAVEIQKPHGRGGVMCFYILSIELISLV